MFFTRLHAVFSCLVAVLLLGASAQGHFLLNVNLRVIHVQHLDTGVQVLLRLPLAYVVANLAGPEQADGTQKPAPYTQNRMENGQRMHYLDVDALRRDPEGLGRLVAQGHHLHVDGHELEASIETVRVYPGISQPPFASLHEALQAITNEPLYPAATDPTYVGDTVVDVALRYHAGGAVSRYTFSSSLNPGLPDQQDTTNLLFDHYPGETLMFQQRGLLEQPLRVSRSAWAAAYTFVGKGIQHILAGYDHVLFVLCLILGAVSFSSLLWRITGFTLGHTITLIVGFFGYLPTAGWFIPAVETAIALSIVYAAVVAILQKPEAASLWITTAIGLLHGFGFAFVLHEILQIDAPHLWQSLLSFNLGVEIGQAGIVLAIWPALWLLARHSEQVLRITRWGIALPCIVIASYWVSQRLWQTVLTLA